VNEPLRIVQHVSKAIVSLADSDLSLIEMAAVLRTAAEACTQAQALVEVTNIIAKNRAKP
jgi:hypothetical protein